jgi:hypothetical protein
LASGAIFSASSRSAVFSRPRQRKTLRVAVLGFFFHLRAARIAEAQELRRLVEGLADGVVDRGADAHIIADAADRDDLGMTARGQKQTIRKGDVVGQPSGQRVTFQMIDGDERPFPDQCNRFGGGQPDDDPPDQSRSGGGRHAVDHVKGARRILHRLGDDAVDGFHMGAGGDFRDHAAKGGMFIGLRQDDIGQDAATPVVLALDEGRRGLVTGRLDAENDHGLTALSITVIPGSSRRRPDAPE